MKIIKSIYESKTAKNFAFLITGNILMQLINVIALIKISNCLNIANFGIYSFLLAQSILISTISDFGLRNLIIRSATKEESDEQNKKMLGAVIIGTTIILISTTAYVIYNYLNHQLTTYQIILIGLSSLILTISNYFEFFLIGKQNIKPIIITNVGTSIIWLIYIVSNEHNLQVNQLFIVFFSISLIKPLFLYIYTKNNFALTFKYPINTNYLKSYISQALPLFGLVVLSIPSNNLTPSFLKTNSNNSQIAYFSLAQKFTAPISMILSVLFTSLFPNYIKIWKEDKTKFQKLVNRSFKLFIYFSTTIIIIYILCINYFFEYFFEKTYLDSLNVIRYQIWYVFLFAIASLMGTILISMHEDKLVFKLSLLNSLITTPILFLTSKAGAEQVAKGYLYSTFIFIIIEWWIFNKKVHLKSNINFIWFYPLTIYWIMYIYK